MFESVLILIQNNSRINQKIMEAVQYRSVIRYLFLKGKGRHEIHDELNSVYGEHSPSLSILSNGGIMNFHAIEHL